MPRKSVVNPQAIELAMLLAVRDEGGYSTLTASVGAFDPDIDGEVRSFTCGEHLRDVVITAQAGGIASREVNEPYAVEFGVSSSYRTLTVGDLERALTAVRWIIARLKTYDAKIGKVHDLVGIGSRIAAVLGVQHLKLLTRKDAKPRWQHFNDPTAAFQAARQHMIEVTTR